VRLERGVRGPLTVVAAPAGFGKTTLLVEWQASAATVPPVAWFSLDAADNDEVRFWSYVLVALQQARPGLGEAALGVLRSPHTPPIETVLARLVHDLLELDEDVVLVLDDYQVIESEAIHRALESLLERLPPRAHVVMLSRAEPPLALARLRVRGQLVELRADDLRFLPDEATAFLSDTMRLDLPERASADLERVTEGWIAGLQLAALALDGRTNPDEFIESFAGTHRFVLDYLIEEVLQRQPQSIQNFLLRTSVLQRLSGPLCEAVAEQFGAGATLEYLDRANLFLVPLDSERRWYRYHHLFAHALRHRLELTQPDAVTELHRRSADWYAGAGFVDEAVGHLLAAGDQRDLDHAAELVEGVVVGLIGIGEVATLLGLIAQLPTYVVQERPRLLLGEAWAFLVGRQYRLMKVRVEAAERVLASRDDISEVVQEELRWESSR
jgi:LuxR family maltose regulon positive regulatory protein